MKNEKNITLNDIAKRLNVSKVTISKALRNHPDIPQKRTEEIKKLASKMGYIPNFAARNLSAKKTRTIGVVIPVIANSFFADIVESIYNDAFENNYNIILAVSQEDSEKERKHLETMLSMKVDGIIVSIVEHSKNNSLFRSIKKRGTPILFFDRTPDKISCSSVTLSNKEGAFNAVSLAIENGYKKIGHIAGWQDSNIGRDRYLGFKDALEKHKIKINPDWVVFSGFGKKDGYDSFMKLYNEKNLPDFLFAVTFPVAHGIIEAAKEVGISIPNDLDIICFGDSELNNYLKPAVSCVTHSTKNFAAEIFSFMLKLIESNNETEEEHIEIETKLLLRETCKKKEKK